MFDGMADVLASYFNPKTGGGMSINDSDGDAANASLYEKNSANAKTLLNFENEGIIELGAASKDQLQQIIGGEQITYYADYKKCTSRIHPRKNEIRILPILVHIAECAQADSYNEISFGSMIRGRGDNGVCVGHCAGRGIDINWTKNSTDFSQVGATVMVSNIMKYLLALPNFQKYSFGFGLPMQGTFFAQNPKLVLFDVVYPASLLVDPELQKLVAKAGYLFLDLPNHLHIKLD